MRALRVTLDRRRIRWRKLGEQVQLFEFASPDAGNPIRIQINVGADD
jgi:hypothetical protein